MLAKVFIVPNRRDREIVCSVDSLLAAPERLINWAKGCTFVEGVPVAFPLGERLVKPSIPAAHSQAALVRSGLPGKADQGEPVQKASFSPSLLGRVTTPAGGGRTVSQ
jgi:hypothetical protein